MGVDPETKWGYLLSGSVQDIICRYVISGFGPAACLQKLPLGLTSGVGTGNCWFWVLGVGARASITLHEDAHEDCEPGRTCELLFTLT